MFKRRQPRPVHHKIREFVWPSLGWGRAARYVGHRLGRLPGSPYRIAAGFACGAAVSFTPFMGFHFVLAMGLSLLMRGNVIASAIGTAVGNPWTFPIIWAWTFNFGKWLLGEVGSDAFASSLTLSHIFDHPMQVLLPMTVGAIPTAIAAWLAFYFPVHSIVGQYQKARRWRLKRKVRARHKRAAAAETKHGRDQGEMSDRPSPIAAGGQNRQSVRSEPAASADPAPQERPQSDKSVTRRRAGL